MMLVYLHHSRHIGRCARRMRSHNDLFGQLYDADDMQRRDKR